MGAAAAGTAWALPIISTFNTGAAAASVACSPAGTYVVDWSTFPNTSPSSGVTALTRNLANYPVNIATLGGTTMQFAWEDSTSALVFAGAQNPPGGTGIRPSTSWAGFTGLFSLFKDNALTDDTATLVMNFDRIIRTLTFTIVDIDYAANDFRDRVRIRPRLGATPVSATIAAVNGNPSFDFDTAATGTDVQVTGDASSASNESRGSLTVTVAGPLDSLRLSYVSRDSGVNPSGDQFIGLSDISWQCI